MVKHVLFWSSIKSFSFIWSKDGPNLTALEDDFNMAAEIKISIFYQLKYLDLLYLSVIQIEPSSCRRRDCCTRCNSVDSQHKWLLAC